METLFEYGDTLNRPYEAFFDGSASMPVRPHWHYYAEMIYMLEGTASVTVDGNDYTVSVGDMVLFHPETVHSIDSTNDSPLKYCVTKFDINRLVIPRSYYPKLGTIFRAARDNPLCKVVFPKNSYEYERTKGIFLRLIWEMNERSFGYDLMMHSHLCILMMDILRYWQDEGFCASSISETENGSEQYIRNIAEYIDAHSSEALSVGKLAEMCGMSYSNFAKRFKQLYGQSCREYIEFIRICKAEDMLLFTSHDLSFISQETGFSDCSHLIKTFRRIKGVTPKQFRMRKNSPKDV